MENNMNKLVMRTAITTLAVMSAVISFAGDYASCKCKEPSPYFRVKDFTTKMENGNRRFVECSFEDSGMKYTADSNIGIFSNGNIKVYEGISSKGRMASDSVELGKERKCYNWTEIIPRDNLHFMNSFSINPDKEPAASDMTFEYMKGATLNDLFGIGKNNLSWILDAEDKDGEWVLTLYFKEDKRLFTGDKLTGDVDICIGERGGNSEIYIRGIKEDGTLLPEFRLDFKDRHFAASCGYDMQTKEQTNPQTIFAMGVNLAGLEFEGRNSHLYKNVVLKGIQIINKEKTGNYGPDIAFILAYLRDYKGIEAK